MVIRLLCLPGKCPVKCKLQNQFVGTGVALSQPLCLALLSVFEACGQSGQAQDVLTAASDAAIPLSVELYNAVLRCCILAQHGERAIEVWEEMQVLC